MEPEKEKLRFAHRSNGFPRTGRDIATAFEQDDGRFCCGNDLREPCEAAVRVARVWDDVLIQRHAYSLPAQALPDNTAPGLAG
jgi:hypothetical protein